MEDLYSENYKILIREVKDDTKRWKDIPSSWIGRIRILKLSIPSKAIFRLSAVPIKIPETFLKDLKLGKRRLVNEREDKLRDLKAERGEAGEIF